MRLRTGVACVATFAALGGGIEAAPLMRDILLQSQQLRTVDVAAGQLALGNTLPEVIARQEDSIVALHTKIPTYTSWGAGSPENWYGSAVILPVQDGNRQILVSAGHNGILQNGEDGKTQSYNCAAQTASAFTSATSFARLPIKAAAGERTTSGRDVSILETSVQKNLQPISDYSPQAVDSIKRGEPIYIMGYSGSQSNGDSVIRTPANLDKLPVGDLNTNNDTSRPVIVGGLVLAASRDHNLLYVLTGLGASFGPQYNDETYAGVSGGGAFTTEGFAGVVTNSYDDDNTPGHQQRITPKYIKDVFGVTLKNVDQKKDYQVAVVNVFQDKDLRKLQADLKSCPATRKAVPDNDSLTQ